ncbi:hypothetical protein TYRP_012889 [Tyrophagus putrescentiae]|nr:hypothetical protein TYRP_012889 [Tyrophagus putrescentiae]
MVKTFATQCPLTWAHSMTNVSSLLVLGVMTVVVVSSPPAETQGRQWSASKCQCECQQWRSSSSSKALLMLLISEHRALQGSHSPGHVI